MVTIATGKFSAGYKKTEKAKASPAPKPPKKKKEGFLSKLMGGGMAGGMPGGPLQ